MFARATKAFTDHVKDVTEKTVAKTCCGGKSSKLINNNNNNNVQLSSYIFDTTTGTTYLKGKLLGKGGFAKCYELTDLRTNKSYAGKIISKSRLAKPHQKEKITREIDLHRQLRHRHVVAFHSCFEDEENVYIVLEYCSRKSLVHMVKSRKTLSEPEVRYFLRQMVDGCKYTHGEKIIHRDLKLGNMLLNENMEIKIADFGLATRVEFEGEKKMTVCGTPNYIAPEVLQKHGHSYEADIWAMGCITYALLVGRPPFETSTLKETYTRIAHNRYTVPAHISTCAKNFMSKLLSPNPSNRPSLDEILTDEFFSSGYTPKMLAPSCCNTQPHFPVLNQLLPRPKSYAAPSLPTEAVQKFTSSLSNLRGGREPHPLKVEISDIHNSDVNMSPSAKVEIQETVINKINGQKRTSAEVKALPLGSALRLQQMLSMCLEQMPEDSNPSPVNAKPLWIVKWVDYSNKYGFGFQLSDRSVGVLFNDSSRMLLGIDGRTIQYFDSMETLMSFTLDAVPADFHVKATLVMYFAQYMNEHLIQGGDMEGDNVQKNQKSPPALFMRKWFRTTKAIIMYLSNGTLQVNFFDDHTKVVVSPDGQDYFVTYINSDRQATTYHLLQLRHFGCRPDISERLQYAKNMLQTITDIEGEDI